jgi:hypothetical protein
VAPQIEQLAATLEDLIIAVGRGIGDAQTELDRSSVALQKAIDADPELSTHGLQATWYQMPRVDLDIRVAVSFQKPRSPATAPAGRPQFTRAAPAVLVYPVNVRFQSQFAFDPSAASTLRVSIVPVPPRVSEAQQVPPRRTADEVTRLAAPYLELQAGTTSPRAGTRVVANFNTAARVWYVVQFVESQGVTTTVATVEVSDETGAAIRRR